MVEIKNFIKVLFTKPEAKGKNKLVVIFYYYFLIFTAVAFAQYIYNVINYPGRPANILMLLLMLILYTFIFRFDVFKEMLNKNGNKNKKNSKKSKNAKKSKNKYK